MLSSIYEEIDVETAQYSPNGTSRGDFFNCANIDCEAYVAATDPRYETASGYGLCVKCGRKING